MDRDELDARVSSAGLKKIIMVDEHGAQEELTGSALACRVDGDLDVKVAFVGLDGEEFLAIVNALAGMAVDFELGLYMIELLTQKMMDREA